MIDNLLQDFNAVDSETWKERLERDLKGITFEQLEKTDSNGLKVAPLYTPNSLQEFAPNFKHNDWGIVERIVVTDEKEANASALHALNCGASVLQFVIAKDEINWEQLFAEIQVNFIQVQLRGNSQAWISSLEMFIANNNINASNIELQKDTLSEYFTGHCETSNLEKELLKNEKTLFLDAEMYYNSGASSVSQLGFVFAQLQELLASQSAEATSKLESVVISISVGTLFFEEIAKLRALRRGVALLLSAYDLNADIIRIDVISGTLYKSKADIYSNLLRDTIAGLAAVVGGCANLCILPFDEKNNRGNENFSYRMAINQQLLMKEESYLDKIADAGNGSFFVETRTTELGTAAWALFKAIESEGGILTQFANGIIQDQIFEEASALINEYKSGAKTWIGVNKYPNATDKPQLGAGVLTKNASIVTLDLEDFLGVNV